MDKILRKMMKLPGNMHILHHPMLLFQSQFSKIQKSLVINYESVLFKDQLYTTVVYHPTFCKY